MYTRRLVCTDKIPKRLLDELQKKYIEPGAWDMNNATINEFKTLMKKELIKLQDGKCAYCELPLETRNPEIEHIAPKGGKKSPKHIECMFLPKNLVYACHNCNSPMCKGRKDVVLDKKNGSDYEKWSFSIVHPYLDDPAEYFDIIPLEDGSPGIIPIPKENLDASHKSKAKNTIEMFQLNGEKMIELAKERIAQKYSNEIISIVRGVSAFRPNLT